MDQEMEITRMQLIQDALSLRERVIQYYRARGDPEAEEGLAAFLERIAEKLAQNPVDGTWISEHIWGIFRLVSDDYYLERSTLGEDLCNFKDRAREFAKKVISGIG